MVANCSPLWAGERALREKKREVYSKLYFGDRIQLFSSSSDKHVLADFFSLHLLVLDRVQLWEQNF